jgi:hypothetical protein
LIAAACLHFLLLQAAAELPQFKESLFSFRTPSFNNPLMQSHALCVACPNSVHHTTNLFLGSEIFHHPLIYIHPQDYYSVPQSLMITSLVPGLTSFGHTNVLFVGGMHLMDLGDDLMMAC